MHHLSIDLETYSSVPLAKAGAQKYIQSPDFEILLFAFSLDGAPVQIIDLARGERLPPWLVQAITSPEYIKHAYNAPFEWGCLSKYLGTLPPNQWRCTMFHGLYCGYTAGLDATGKALGLPQDKQKLNTGKALIRYFCIPCKPTKANGQRTRNLPQHDPAKWELFKEYCKQDVVTEMEIERRLSAFMPPDWVQKQWETDLIINARGVAVDLELVTGALYLGDTVRQTLTAEAVRLSGLSNPNSVAQLSAWLQEEIGEELADLRKDTVARLLGRDNNSAQVSRMLEIRQELGKTSTKKYDAIEAAVCEDGRVRGLLQFYGANRTGRWAGRLVQVQNLPRTYTEPLDLARELVKSRKLDALRLIYGSVPDTLSQLIRTAFVAPEGHVLIDADFSAIEARVISWLAGEQWRLEVFRTHGKIYEASASQMFGVPLELIKKGNPEYALRQKGKVAELALGYQGSTGALITMGALDMGLTEEELPDIVSRWREANKRIRDLWYSMDSAAVQVITEGGSVGVNGLLLAREYDYDMVIGEAVWMSGHIGIYIGDGLAVECTPKWENKVQITAVGNIGSKAGYNTRTWTKHGKLPYVDYTGAATGGSTGGATQPSTPSGSAQMASVGDTVTFTGTKHYVSSNATNGATCKPGKAKVTAVAKNAKHPYHLIKVAGGGSTVYGWVDAADIQVDGAVTVGAKVKVNKGAKTYTGGSLASFVYNNTYTVMQIDGSRVVIGQNGTVTAAVNINDLTLGKKKKDLPAGVRMMHYEGLRGFSQDGPCFMEKTDAGLVFQQVNGPAATLPLEKVTGLEMLPERNFMARYHGTAATTAHGKAVKWFAVFHYTTQEGERMLTFWYLEPKTGDALRELSSQIGATAGDYTL